MFQEIEGEPRVGGVTEDKREEREWLVLSNAPERSRKEEAEKSPWTLASGDN